MPQPHPCGYTGGNQWNGGSDDDRTRLGAKSPYSDSLFTRVEGDTDTRAYALLDGMVQLARNILHFARCNLRLSTAEDMCCEREHPESPTAGCARCRRANSTRRPALSTSWFHLHRVR